MTLNHKGFTLAEILVVVTILVVLGLALLVGINPMAQIFKGYDARRKSDLIKLKTALENYYSDHDCYPNFKITGVVDDKNNPSYVCDSNFLSPYLVAMPCDPNSKKPYLISTIPTDSTCPQQFAIYAQIFSFFDKNANVMPYCPKIFAVNSPNMAQINLINGCQEMVECYIHYGCVAGACKIVAEGDMPDVGRCPRIYCESDCGGLDEFDVPNNCKIPANNCRY